MVLYAAALRSSRGQGSNRRRADRRNQEGLYLAARSRSSTVTRRLASAPSALQTPGSGRKEYRLRRNIAGKIRTHRKQYRGQSSSPLVALVETETDRHARLTGLACQYRTPRASEALAPGGEGYMATCG